MKSGVLFFSAVLVLFSSGVGATQKFGYDGYDGRDGLSGRDGRSGQGLSILADGSFHSYSLFGSDGEDGRDAYRGEDAGGCSQPWNTPYDLYGARGGHGGRGGRGGDGGDGGDLTVYSADISYLKGVYVLGAPGEGGRPGWGNPGGRPCYCSKGSWQVSNGSTTQTYHCSNGQQGQYGHEGYSGKRGNYGRVTVINQVDPVEPSKEQLAVKMDQMEASFYDLSSNNWESRKGGRALFAAGSMINDNYLMYLGRTEVRYGLAWNVNRPLSDFLGRQLTLILRGGKVQVSLPSDIWSVGVETPEVGYWRFAFTKALFSREVFDLKISSVEGAGKNLVARVVDGYGVSDQVETSYSIDYYTPGIALWRLRYSGKIPPEAITEMPTGHSIAVGSLPIPSKYLSAGTQVLIDLKATRRLGQHSGTKTVSFKQTLKQ